MTRTKQSIRPLVWKKAVTNTIRFIGVQEIYCLFQLLPKIEIQCKRTVVNEEQVKLFVWSQVEQSAFQNVSLKISL